MDWGTFLPGAWIFLVGLALGSFCNVLIYRLPRRQNIAVPGSQCMMCKAPVRARDNIPILSYLILRGRCWRCSYPFSARYPLIEFLCGMLALAAYARLGWGAELFFRALPLVTLCLAIVFIDLDHRIIPDRLNFTGLVWGLGTSFFSTHVSWKMSVLGALLGFGFFYFFAWVYTRLTQREGLGGGDIKFLAMSGAFTGPEGVLTTVTVSSVIGSIVGILFALYYRKKGGRSHPPRGEATDRSGEDEPESLGRFAIPFGPFLVLGTLYSYFFGG